MTFMTALRRLPLFPILAGLSLAIGCLVPSIYEFTQQPAARHQHSKLQWIAMIVLGLTAIVCTFAVARPARLVSPPTRPEPPAKFQFSLRRLFVATTLVAGFCALARVADLPYSSCLVLAMVAGVFAWSFRESWPVRWRIASNVSAMFLPFVWMVPFSRPFGRTSGLLAGLPLGPGIVYTEIVRAFTSRNPDAFVLLAALLVIAQLFVGVWLARRGGKLFGTFLALELLSACLSSLAFHAAYRM